MGASIEGFRHQNYAPLAYVIAASLHAAYSVKISAAGRRRVREAASGYCNDLAAGRPDFYRIPDLSFDQSLRQRGDVG